MFEKAVKMKLRIDHKGQLSVEDLWDLSLEELDSIYQKLMEEQRTLSTDSLLKRRNQASTELTLKIEIVKYIVNSKLTDKEEAKNRADSKVRREKIAAVLERKRDKALEEMSEEDLEKELKEF